MKANHELQVLFEDNHLIAVIKPSGMLVQKDHHDDQSLLDLVRDYLKEKYNKPGNVFVGLIHRLDRPVSGVVLFAKTSKGASRLSEQFRKRTVTKTYHCLVEGLLKNKAGTIISYLEKNEEKNITKCFQQAGPNRDRAELAYEVIETNKKISLLKVNLLTGRSHQIRAQLADIGHPILGDTKYGSKIKLSDSDLAEIALAATSLEFKLATKDETKVVEMEIPSNWSAHF